MKLIWGHIAQLYYNVLCVFITSKGPAMKISGAYVGPKQVLCSWHESTAFSLFSFFSFLFAIFFLHLLAAGENGAQTPQSVMGW